MKYTSVAVMLLINGSGAVKIQREPLNSAPARSDWAFQTAQKTGPGHPVDYSVPDFGVDREIKNTQKSIADAEKLKSHELTFGSAAPAAEHPKDYYVPDFGVDGDVKTTLNNAGAAEKAQGHFWEATKAAPAGNPVDYFVPNFGQDKEIKTTQKSISDMEKNMHHQLTYTTGPAPAEHPKNYFVPDFGVDGDVKTTLNNAGTAEKQYGHFWDATKAAPADHPKDYFVPNFGQDKVITTTQKSIMDAENLLNHKLVLQTKAAAEPPRDYPVANFGLDHDIKDSLNHLNNQEAQHGTWNIPSFVQIDEQAQREPLLSNLNTQKWKGKYPINYFVPHFGADGDINDSKANTEAEEKLLEHKWEPYQQENDAGDMEWQRIPGFFTLNGRSN